jgi:hypothetical protein
MPRTLLLALVAAAPLTAAEPPAPPKTLMTEPGKLLFRDDLTTAPGKEWRVAKGKWEPADGALRASELKSDKHAAVIRHAMPFRSAVLQYSFKLDGARQTTLSINTAKGHLCRVLINKDGFTVRKDDSDHAGPDTAVAFETKKTPIAPGTWHTLVVELHGKEMVATLDGQQTAFGGHDALDADKANFGLTVGGESVSFKDLRVWEATAKKDWEMTKANLRGK